MKSKLLTCACLSSFLIAAPITASALAEEPALPAGLGGFDDTSSEPSLPTGLGTDEPSLPSGLDFDSADEPSLPEGMDAISTDGTALEENDEWDTEEYTEESSLPFELTGFVETRGGLRIHDQSYEKSASIGEARLQLQAEKYWDNISIRLTSDFIYDPVADRHAIDLKSGDGWIDLREAFVSWRATDFMDIKAGRQVLTWGTGDLVFINDLFPKDFNSFFIGRDVEYLKAPSDALKTSFFSPLANLDVVYTPNVNSDRFADGARISVFEKFSGGLTGRNAPLSIDPRGKWFAEDEWAARIYRNFGAYESALYGYNGYWKNPQGSSSPPNRYTFPRMAAYGASVRGPVFGGIGNIETGYYDSLDDRNGEASNIANSQFRFLVGYEQEIASELTGGLQYSLERTLDFDAMKRNSPAGSPMPEENRHLVTTRLTKQLMDQNLTLSLFNFWSPNESDGYVRPKANYKINDQWTAEAGGNIFYGSSRDTFFGQLEDNSNVYLSLRYSF